MDGLLTYFRFSPNNSLARPYSPKSTTNLAADYNRPQPPPYVGTNAHHRKHDRTPTHAHTPEHNRGHLALEESLKLLNEANITSEFDNLLLQGKIIDLADGSDDYVPIKPDSTEYLSLKPDKTGYGPNNPDLDDINVPELAKYGISGIGQI